MSDSLSSALLVWYDQSARVLPWRSDPTPYHIWVSEMMLQQTQVDTVLPYYQGFMSLFPDVFSLASAPQADVLKAWEGLGYYSRARNLHRAAQKVVAEYSGQLPQDLAQLRQLQDENAKLKRMYADLALMHHALKDVVDRKL